jgi:hypothetical protein
LGSRNDEEGSRKDRGCSLFRPYAPIPVIPSQRKPEESAVERILIMRRAKPGGLLEKRTPFLSERHR